MKTSAGTKFLVLLAAGLLMMGLGVAPSHTSTSQQDNQQDTPSTDTGQAPEDTQNSGSGQQAQAQDKGPKESKKPSLPEQASSTAKDVVDTVFGAVGNIGKALSNLFS